jgi:hypothetical protein
MFRRFPRRGRSSCWSVLAWAPFLAVVVVTSGVGSTPGWTVHGRVAGLTLQAPTGTTLLPASETSIPVSGASELLGVNPSDGSVAVGSTYEGTVTWIDGTSVAGTANLGEYPGGDGMSGAYDPSNSTYYVGTSSEFFYSTSGNGTITAFHGTKSIGESIVPAFREMTYDPALPGMFLITLDHGLEVLEANGSTVPVPLPPQYSNTTGPPPPPVPVSFGPMLYDGAEESLYVATGQSNQANMTFLDVPPTLASTELATDSVPPGFLSLWENDASGNVFVSSPGSDLVPEIQDGAITATLHLPGHGGTTGVFDAETGLSYVLNESGEGVYAFNPYTPVAIIPLGTYANSLAVDPVSGRVYATELNANAVAVLDGTHLLGTMPTGQYPGGALFDASNGVLYVLDSAGVLAIRPGASSALSALELYVIIGVVAGAAAIIAVAVWYRHSRKAKPVGPN